MFALADVNFKDIIHYPNIEIQKERATFICGQSGCGKSTMLKLLNGVLSVDGGIITYLGKNVEELEPIAHRRDVLLVSQSVFLFDSSIKYNFNEYYAYRELEYLNEEEMKFWLELCCVQLPLDAMCQRLSGGERHRVFMAINCSFRPKVLMLDEPTSALDDKNSNELIGNMVSYCKKNSVTLIIVSHDIALAEQYADCIITLTKGAQQ